LNSDNILLTFQQDALANLRAKAKAVKSLVIFIAMHFTLTHPSELQSSISITFISTLPLVHTRPSHHTTRSHVALRFIIMFSHMHIHTTCAYVLTCAYTPHKHMLSRAHTHHIYRSVPHIRPLSRIPPLRFQPKFLHRYFYLAYRPPNHGHSTKMIFVETPTLSSSRSP